MNRVFTLQEIMEHLSPTIPDTYSVGVRMYWPDQVDNYNEFEVPGYLSSENACVAADIFRGMGEDITLAFKDHGQLLVEYQGQEIKVSIKRVAGSNNGDVRY